MKIVLPHAVWYYVPDWPRAYGPLPPETEIHITSWREAQGIACFEWHGALVCVRVREIRIQGFIAALKQHFPT